MTFLIAFFMMFADLLCGVLIDPRSHDRGYVRGGEGMVPAKRGRSPARIIEIKQPGGYTIKCYLVDPFKRPPEQVFEVCGYDGRHLCSFGTFIEAIEECGILREYD